MMTDNREKMKYQAGDYIYMEPKIGTGSFARVYKGYHKVTGQVVAVKVIHTAKLSKNNQKLKQHLADEIAIMKPLDHKNIVKLFDVIVSSSKTHIHMMLEYCEGGDLATYLRKHKRLSEQRAKYFMQQLALGLQFLRRKNIIHRDLKPQNLLLSDHSEYPTLKIADFGFARLISNGDMAATLCGSPLYMAPEILELKAYTVKADLWSVGVILYEMLAGVPPFEVNTPFELIKVLETKNVVFPADIPISKDCLDLIYGLLKKDVTQRISWEEFFMHPWLGIHQPLSSSPMAVASSPSPRNYSFPITMSPSPTNYTLPQQSPSSVSSSPSSLPNTPSSLPNTPSSLPNPSPSPPNHLYFPNHSVSPPKFQPPAFAPFVSPPSNINNMNINSSNSNNNNNNNNNNNLNTNTAPIPIGPPKSEPISFQKVSPPFSLPSQPQSFGSAGARHSLSSTKDKIKFSPSEQPNIRTPMTNPFKENLDSSSSGGSLSTSPPHFNRHPLVKQKSAGSFTSSDSFEKDCVILDHHEGEHASSSTEDQFVANIDAKGKRALAVAELGDIKADGDQAAEAVALYLKSLKMMNQTLQGAKRVAQAHSLTSSPRVVSAVEKIRERFAEYFKKVEYWRGVVKPSDTVPCVEKIIYEYAIQMGRIAGVDELWKNYAKSEEVYQTGMLLLETLYFEANEAKDREVLQVYINAFANRLAAVRKLMAAAKRVQ